MNKLVSIIVPIYNKQNTIIRCIDSILNQKYINIELILVDDGSTDNSYKICEEFCKNTLRKVILLNQCNQGVSAARNKGLNICTGDYVQFVDADDSVDLNMTGTLVKAMEENQAEIIICGYNRISCGSNDKELSITKQPPLKPGQYTKASFAERFSDAQYGKLMGWELIADKIYKHKIIKDNKLSFIEGLPYGEDCDFNFKYLDCCSKIIVREDCLYNYYIYTYESGVYSASTGFKKDLYSLQNQIYDGLRCFLTRNNIFSAGAREGFYHTYINESIKAIYRYCREDCSLNHNEKLAMLREIMKNPVTIEALRLYKPKNKQESRGMAMVMKLKNPYILKWYSEFKVKKIYGKA